MTSTTPPEPPIEHQRALRGLILRFEPGFVAFYRTTPNGFVLDRVLPGCGIAGHRGKPRYSYPVTIPRRIAWGLNLPAPLKRIQEP